MVNDNDSSAENSEINDSQTEIDTVNSIRFLLTNARSLKPKISSLAENFDTMKLHFACITETWFRGGRNLEQSLDDFEGANAIKFLHKSRDGRGRGPAGGGVALAFDTRTCNFKRRKISNAVKGHEILSAVGKVGNIARKVVVLVVYIPPKTKAAAQEEIAAAVSNEIARAHAEYNNPLVVIGGDFNKRDISAGLADSCVFEEAQTGPTRGPNKLDLVYTNFGSSIQEAQTLPPLQSEVESIVITDACS